MNNKPKLRIPIKQKYDKPITVDNLRTCPGELAEAETPEAANGYVRSKTTLPEMLSITQAVEKTNLSYEYLRYLCYSGKVNHIKCGRKYMIDSDSLAEYIRNGGVEQ